MNDFFTWLNNELDTRGWSNSELARRAGLAHSTVSMTLSGKNKVTWEFCAAIAAAFHIPPVTVFTRAGLLPPSQDPQTIQEIVDVARKLGVDEVELLRDIGLLMLKRREQG